MEEKDYLKDELKRLNRMNDLLEKKINQCANSSNEPEQIANNVHAMCQIANAICNLKHNCLMWIDINFF